MRISLVWVGILLIASCAPALAQGAATGGGPATPQGMFPVELGYAAVALAGTVWATLSAVVAKLWSGLKDQRADHKAEVDSLRNRLEKEQQERREEAERLLREQKDIFREVVVTCSQVGDALREAQKALEWIQDQWEE